MKDFLTRMARRSRGEAEVVEPRLPSLFAPQDEASVVETGDATPWQPSTSGPGKRTAPSSGKAAAERGQPQPAAHNAPTAEQPIVYEHAVKQPDTTETGITPLATLPDNGDEVANTSAPDVVENIGVPVREQQERSAQPAPLLLDDDQLAVTATGNRDTSFDSTMTMSVQNVSVAQQPSLPLVPGYTSNQPTPQQTMSELPTVTQHDTKEEPTVHINIGRVEVRAHTSAPVPAPRPVRSQPASSLSLDAYLKQGGGKP
ncbi:MAG: hypothetical protein GY732_15630 [Gammaproteobacteria bacterium]|nr:hypothetical protein [Gammaproteobacteria bacterium]